MNIVSSKKQLRITNLKNIMATTNEAIASIESLLEWKDTCFCWLSALYFYTVDGFQILKTSLAKNGTVFKYNPKGSKELPSGLPLTRTNFNQFLTDNGVVLNKSYSTVQGILF